MSDPGWFSGDPFPGAQSSDAPLFDEQDRYEIRGVLGIGGMGRVHAAFDRHLHREVALKVVDDPQHARRMAREAWITAQLEHPAIVPVHDAGRTPDGRPFYTMRLVRGRTLAVSLREAETLTARLERMTHFLAACQAVAFAHDVGIVHRDLKPDNVLVGRFGETQVADWGLARPVAASEADWARQVLRGAPDPEPAGTVVGTPRYMAPEQARGEPCAPTADVWSLGVMLYELLSGQPAYGDSESDAVMARVRRGEGPALPELDAPVELRAIVRRATAAATTERYPNALALAEDVQRWLDGHRVLAHAYSSAELLQRLVRAWRGPLAVGALALVVLLMAGAMANRRLAAERDVTRAWLAEAEAHLADALTAQAVAAYTAGARPEAEVLAASALLHGERAGARGVLAATAWSPRPTRSAPLPLPSPCQDGNAVPSPDRTALACLGGQELLVWELADTRVRWRREVRDTEVWWLDDDALLVVPPERVLRRIDAHSGELLGEVPREIGGDVVPLGPSHALLASGTQRFVQPLLGGEGLALTDPDCHIFRLHPDGDGWLAACAEGPVMRLDLANPAGVPVAGAPEVPDPSALLRVQDTSHVATFSGRLHPGLDQPPLAVGSPVMQLVPVPGRPLMLVRAERDGPRIFDLERREWVGRLPGGTRVMAAGAEDGEVWLMGERLERWRFPPAPRPAAVYGSSGLASLAWTPDGARLLYGDGQAEVGIIEVAHSRLQSVIRLGSEPRVVKGVAASSSSQAMASAIEYGTRAFSPVTGEIDDEVPILNTVLRRLLAVQGGYLGLSYARALVFADDDGLRHRIDTEDFHEAGVSPDGATVALLSSHAELWTLEVASRTLTRRFTWPDGVAVVPDRGATRLWLSRQNELCRTDAGGQILACRELDSPITDLALSPDAQRVAASTYGGQVWVLDADTLHPRSGLRAHDARAVAVAFSPDGTLLASAGWDGQVHLWELAVIEQPAAALAAELRQAWGLDLDAALGTVATDDEMPTPPSQ